MKDLKRWHVVLAFVLSCLAGMAKAAEYLDGRIDERVQAVAVPRQDFERLEGKVDHITDLLLAGPKRR